MEEQLAHFLRDTAWPLLAVIIVLSLGLLGKAADWLVAYAVMLSEFSGIPKLVVGATIVSLGTTMPEAVVSVLAAIQGKPGLAMGNAVGSIICDTGLILGLACLITPLPLDRKVVNRQGWLQFGSGLLLVVASFSLSSSPFSAFQTGGRLERGWGFLFLLLLLVYIWQSIRWSRIEGSEASGADELENGTRAILSVVGVVARLALAILVVVGSSWILIPSVSEAAMRMSIPESIIAVTMVAFGTSLPEMVTAITAARQGHGELAVGNVIGADILNVLFVAGASAAVTQGGLESPAHFFTFYFPSMLLMLLVFRLGIRFSGNHLKRPFGLILVASYLVVTVGSYVR